jgi:hypothetical protein
MMLFIISQIFYEDFEGTISLHLDGQIQEQEMLFG